ncbi:hypothetical protein ACFW0I_38555, partial [[Kitasatospora] papulosa]|uniref:hypothetical protein n=1 Tax=[Kitasatospora] papulosa TaxID=1464011 RepID=UPI003695B636
QYQTLFLQLKALTESRVPRRIRRCSTGPVRPSAISGPTRGETHDDRGLKNRPTEWSVSLDWIASAVAVPRRRMATAISYEEC